VLSSSSFCFLLHRFSTHLFCCVCAASAHGVQVTPPPFILAGATPIRGTFAGLSFHTVSSLFFPLRCRCWGPFDDGTFPTPSFSRASIAVTQLPVPIDCPFFIDLLVIFAMNLPAAKICRRKISLLPVINGERSLISSFRYVPFP